MLDSQLSREDDVERRSFIGVGLAIGLAIGAGLGVALDNLAIGIGVGVAVGAGFGVAMDARRHKARKSSADAGGGHASDTGDRDKTIDGGSDDGGGGGD